MITLWSNLKHCEALFAAISKTLVSQSLSNLGLRDASASKKQYWKKHQIVTLEEIKVFVDCEIHGAKKLPKADENLMLFCY